MYICGDVRSPMHMYMHTWWYGPIVVMYTVPLLLRCLVGTGATGHAVDADVLLKAEITAIETSFIKCSYINVRRRMACGREGRVTAPDIKRQCSRNRTERNE